MGKRLDEIYAMAVPLPISEEAHQQAKQFATKQPSGTKAQQVYNNTLAVWVMNDYFKMLDITTDRASSDSWNPAVQLMADVADLVLPGVGRLECRPTLVSATNFAVPPETWTLRVGYSVVELSEDLQTARFLGFTPTANTDTIALEELSSPEDLIEHLHALQRVSAAAKEPVSRGSESTAPMTVLSQWFDHIFQAGWVGAGWQTVDDLLATVTLTPEFSYRSSEAGQQGNLLSHLADEPGASIHKGKLINLALRLGSQQVLLLIRLQSQTMDEVHISAQVYPVAQPCLPPDLELLVVDASGEAFMQAQARQADNYIQLQFTGKPGEPFTTQIKLEDIYHSEQFVV